jgi:hypothetical protein
LSLSENRTHYLIELDEFHYKFANSGLSIPSEVWRRNHWIVYQNSVRKLDRIYDIHDTRDGKKKISEKSEQIADQKITSLPEIASDFHKRVFDVVMDVCPSLEIASYQLSYLTANISSIDSLQVIQLVSKFKSTFNLSNLPVVCVLKCETFGDFCKLLSSPELQCGRSSGPTIEKRDFKFTGDYSRVKVPTGWSFELGDAYHTKSDVDAAVQNAYNSLHEFARLFQVCRWRFMDSLEHHNFVWEASRMLQAWEPKMPISWAKSIGEYLFRCYPRMRVLSHTHRSKYDVRKVEIPSTTRDRFLWYAQRGFRDIENMKDFTPPYQAGVWYCYPDEDAKHHGHVVLGVCLSHAIVDGSGIGPVKAALEKLLLGQEVTKQDTSFFAMEERLKKSITFSPNPMHDCFKRFPNNDRMPCTTRSMYIGGDGSWLQALAKYMDTSTEILIVAAICIAIKRTKRCCRIPLSMIMSMPGDPTHIGNFAEWREYDLLSGWTSSVIGLVHTLRGSIRNREWHLPLPPHPEMEPRVNINLLPMPKTGQLRMLPAMSRFQNFPDCSFRYLDFYIEHLEKDLWGLRVMRQSAKYDDSWWSCFHPAISDALIDMAVLMFFYAIFIFVRICSI